MSSPAGSAAAIPYSVRISTRSRRVRVRVDPQRGVEVIVAPGSAPGVAAAAVAELRPWIERQLAARADVLARAGRHADGSLPYLDERLELVAQLGRTRAHRRGVTLLVPAEPALRGAAIERWYRRAARDEVCTRLDGVCARVGTRYTRLTIRDQRTRWASCTTAGAMSFNWRLLLGPDRVLDYVVWHEVCHLEVADHSPRFWALLESRLPGWREPAGWLREHGAALVLDAPRSR